MKDLEWYLNAIRHEVEQINEKDFVGSVDFKINIRQGSIGNMNITLNKSVKNMEKANA